jgi:hypothetical protein
MEREKKKFFFVFIFILSKFIGNVHYFFENPVFEE